MNDHNHPSCHDEHAEIRQAIDDHTHQELEAVDRIIVLLEGPVDGENLDGTPKHDGSQGLVGKVDELIERGVKIRIPWFKIGTFTGGVILAIWGIV